jgi:hypothetical protein
MLVLEDLPPLLLLFKQDVKMLNNINPAVKYMGILFIAYNVIGALIF